MMNNNQRSVLNSKQLFYLYQILAALFIANTIIAELVGVKIFSLSAIFGLNSDWNMSVGVLMWPFVFVLSDLINEYFGVNGVKRISFIAAGLIAYAFVIIYISTGLPPAKFWQELYAFDSKGNPFDINESYSMLLKQGMGIIVGSLTAFMVGQLVDAYVFQFIRKKTGHAKLWLRATGSTLISQLIDSFLVLFIAFYLLGRWSFEQVIAVASLQYVYKVGLAIALTPLLNVVHTWIDRYLGATHEEKDIKGIV